MLDVGAGDGSLLDALAARGREAAGLEPEPRRPDVRDADITELDDEWSRNRVLAFPGAPARVPERPSTRAALRLRPGGALIVAAPNAASLQARVFGDRWFHLDLPRHLVHLPAKALTRPAGRRWA